MTSGAGFFDPVKLLEYTHDTVGRYTNSRIRYLNRCVAFISSDSISYCAARLVILDRVIRKIDENLSDQVA